MQTAAAFEHLVPEVMLDAVEQATGRRLTGMARPLPSYINRVYDVQTMDGEHLIAKFYRPGRWSREALLEEHLFLADCAADEIPVVCPLPFPDGSTLAQSDGVFFTVFPKRLGRQFEVHTRTDWLRVGRLLGRVHTAGSRRVASHRTSLHPDESTAGHIDYLLDHDLVTASHRAEFEDVAETILDDIRDRFEDVEFIRIHGDCHGGNILNRPGEGLLLIDFDDMMVGPPVQDFWLLLPGHVPECRFEIDLLVRGYEQFREFDDRALQLVEPLRAMRIIYFLAWCARQVHDYKFRQDHPQWGSDVFWRNEIRDLWMQHELIGTSGSA